MTGDVWGYVWPVLIIVLGAVLIWAAFRFFQRKPICPYCRRTMLPDADVPPVYTSEGTTAAPLFYTCQGSPARPHPAVHLTALDGSYQTVDSEVAAAFAAKGYRVERRQDASVSFYDMHKQEPAP